MVVRPVLPCMPFSDTSLYKILLSINADGHTTQTCCAIGVRGNFQNFDSHKCMASYRNGSCMALFCLEIPSELRCSLLPSMSVGSKKSCCRSSTKDPSSMLTPRRSTYGSLTLVALHLHGLLTQQRQNPDPGYLRQLGRSAALWQKGGAGVGAST